MTNYNKEIVTILKSEHDRLLERDYWLECLQAAGVDNWQGIETAIQILNEDD